MTRTGATLATLITLGMFAAACSDDATTASTTPPTTPVTEAVTSPELVVSSDAAFPEAR